MHGIGIDDIRRCRIQQGQLVIRYAAVVGVDRRRPVEVGNSFARLRQGIAAAFCQRLAGSGPAVSPVQRQGVNHLAACFIRDGYGEALTVQLLAVAIQIARKALAHDDGIQLLGIRVPDIQNLNLAILGQRIHSAIGRHAAQREAARRRILGAECEMHHLRRFRILHHGIAAHRQAGEHLRPVIFLAQEYFSLIAILTINRGRDHLLGEHCAVALQIAGFREVLGHNNGAQLLGVVVLHQNVGHRVRRHADADRIGLGYAAADKLVVDVLVVADIAHRALGHGIAADRQIGKRMRPAAIHRQIDALHRAAVRRGHGDGYRRKLGVLRQAFISLADRQAADLSGHRVGESHGRAAAASDRERVRRYRIGVRLALHKDVSIHLLAVHADRPGKIILILERVAVRVLRVHLFNRPLQARFQIRKRPGPHAVLRVAGAQNTLVRADHFAQAVFAGDEHPDARGNLAARAEGFLQHDGCQRIIGERIHQLRHAVMIQIGHVCLGFAPVDVHGNIAAVNIVVSAVKVGCRLNEGIIVAGGNIAEDNAAVFVRRHLGVFPDRLALLAFVCMVVGSQAERNIAVNLFAVLIHLVKFQLAQQALHLRLTERRRVNAAVVGGPVALCIRHGILQRRQIVDRNRAVLIQQRIVIGQMLVLQAHLIFIGVARIAADRTVVVIHKVIVRRFAAQNVPYIIRLAISGVGKGRVSRMVDHRIIDHAIAGAVGDIHLAQIGDVIAHSVRHAPCLRRQLNLIHNRVEGVKQVGRLAVIGRRGERGEPLADGHLIRRCRVRIAPVAKCLIIPETFAHADGIQLGKALAANSADGIRLIAHVLGVFLIGLVGAASLAHDMRCAVGAAFHMIRRLAVGQQDGVQIINTIDTAAVFTAIVDHVLGQHQAGLKVRAALVGIAAAVAHLDAVDVVFRRRKSGRRRHIIPDILGPGVGAIQHDRHHALIVVDRAGVQAKIAHELNRRALGLLHAGCVHRALRRGIHDIVITLRLIAVIAIFATVFSIAIGVSARAVAVIMQRFAVVLLAAQITAAFAADVHRVGYVNHQHSRRIRRFAGKRHDVLLRLDVHRHDELILRAGSFDGFAQLHPGIGIAGERAAYAQRMAVLVIPFGAADIGNLILRSHCARTDRQQHKKHDHHRKNLLHHVYPPSEMCISKRMISKVFALYFHVCLLLPYYKPKLPITSSNIIALYPPEIKSISLNIKYNLKVFSSNFILTPLPA